MEYTKLDRIPAAPYRSKYYQLLQDLLNLQGSECLEVALDPDDNRKAARQRIYQAIQRNPTTKDKYSISIRQGKLYIYRR